MADAPDPEVAADTAPQPEAPPTLHGFALSDSRGQPVVHVPREHYVDLIKALTDEGYTQITDICGVDYLTYPNRAMPAGVSRERFELAVNVLDIENRRRMRVRVQIPEDDPSCPSLFDLHPGTEAMEREVFDMFGIVFTDHPDLTRILMPEDWEGHPLRKDYDPGAIPVQFTHDYRLADAAPVAPEASA